jgi:hypothetical protein
LAVLVKTRPATKTQVTKKTTFLNIIFLLKEVNNDPALATHQNIFLIAGIVS